MYKNTKYKLTLELTVNRLNAATPAFYINTQEFNSANNISTNLFCVNPESFLVQNTVVQKANYFHHLSATTNFKFDQSAFAIYDSPQYF